MNKTVLHVKKLSSFWEKSIGLIGKRIIRPVYFTTRWGIHTFGVQAPIDVLILDDTMHVVKIAQRLPPNRIFVWNPKYKHVIELPGGSLQSLKTIKLGTHLCINHIRIINRPDS